MRVAVISDVHSNLQALDAVMAELDADPPDAVLCAGDIVG
ncbi:MAG: metallophosphoesterase family protein, partial [Thermoplasmata archaeon]